MKSVILCDGEHPGKNQLQNDLKQASLFIAADGGAQIAIQLNLYPDIIIGDLDSYEVTGEEECEVIHDPDQETNDLEKALKFALTKSVTDVIVYGATGKRVDHTLKNLSVLLQFDSEFRSIVFKDRYSVMSIVKSPFRKALPIGTSVSLFPLSGKVKKITTSGLQYPLKEGVLENGKMDGTSNRTVKKIIEIVFEKGDLLLLINL